MLKLHILVFLEVKKFMKKNTSFDFFLLKPLMNLRVQKSYNFFEKTKNFFLESLVVFIHNNETINNLILSFIVSISIISSK